MINEQEHTFCSKAEWMQKVTKITEPGDRITTEYWDKQPVITFRNCCGCVISIWFEDTTEYKFF